MLKYPLNPSILGGCPSAFHSPLLPISQACGRPGSALFPAYTSLVFPSTDPKTSWGSRDLLFIYIVREDTPPPQILHQYLLWLYGSMRTLQRCWLRGKKVTSSRKIMVWFLFFLMYSFPLWQMPESQSHPLITQFNTCSKQVLDYYLYIWGLYFLLPKSMTQLCKGKTLGTFSQASSLPILPALW